MYLIHHVGLCVQTHTHTHTQETHMHTQQTHTPTQHTLTLPHKRHTKQRQPGLMTQWTECMYVSTRKCVHEYS